MYFQSSMGYSKEIKCGENFQKDSAQIGTNNQ